MKKRVCVFSIADQNNLPYFKMMEASLRHWHNETELPLVLIGPEQLKNQPDPMFFYRATPLIGQQLLKEYETVIKLDADQVITGKLNHIWDTGFDVAVVQNSNPKEMQRGIVSVWDINPMAYVNCGLVAMRNTTFVDHWLKLCLGPHFNTYQYKEQDLLNIMVFYGDYNVRFLDDSDKWHGLAVKGYEPLVKLVGDKLILPRNKEWPQDKDKQIVVWHTAGGNIPNKLNYHIRFQPDVARWIDKLVKP